jgi:uncharacterized phiE125 gp8 family phage protein
MPSIITTEALPNDTYVLTIVFRDDEGNPVTPNDPTTWGLTDSEGNTINSRADVAITEASSVDVVLFGDDLAATGVYDDGIRIVTVEGDYDSDAGNGLPLNQSHWFVIGDNIQPVSLADAKRHLNIAASNTDHDVYIAGLITAARAQVEAYTNRKLLTQTVTRYFDGFPDGNELVLPYGNLASVTSVHYKGTDGNWTEFTSTYWTAQTEDEPGKVVLKYNQSWPTATLHPSKPVRVIYSCGYGATFGAVPASIRHAIKLIVSDLFEQREPYIAGVSYKPLPTVRALLSQYYLPGGFV